VRLGEDLANQLTSRSGAAEILAVAKKQTADEVRRLKAAKMAAAATAAEEERVKGEENVSNGSGDQYHI